MNVLGNLRIPFSKSADALVSGATSEPPEEPADPQPERERSISDTPHSNEDPSELGTPVPVTVPLEVKGDSRRWSFQYVIRHVRKPALTAAEEHEKRTRSATASIERAVHAPKLKASDRRARHNAVLVRNLIIGPEGISPPTTNAKPVLNKSDVNKTKAALLKPREANKLIAQLRTLPPADAPGSAAPIHAVCLPITEVEADQQHFQRLKADDTSSPIVTAVRSRDINAAPPLKPTVVSATLDSISDAFSDLSLVSLIESPDFGLGQSGDGKGVLAGALPTAETVVNGVVQITPQLMSLGYATGKAIIPNHTGIYPPTDRMSVLTYWWGLELVLPPPTIAYLSQTQSISHTVLNFLSAIALVHGGVREILPFVRYISQFVDFEFSSIKQADRGKGVVCAATWIMPAALVPRAWDFPTPPAKPPTKPSAGTTSPGGSPGIPTDDSSSPSAEVPSDAPVQSGQPDAPVPDKRGSEIKPIDGSPSQAPPSEPALISPIALLPGAST